MPDWLRKSQDVPMDRPLAQRQMTIDEARRRRFRPRSEASRVRDTLINLQAWRNVYRPGASFDISPFRGGDTASPPTPRPTPQVCPDSALLSFAQLATWRLDARRAFVALVSSDRVYVLAEASKSMAFQHDKVKDGKDAASIGTCSFPRVGALADGVMTAWQAARQIREPSEEEDHYHTEGVSPHWHIVSDLRLDPACQEIPYVKHTRWSRFYSAVPIRSAQGSVVGFFFIMDDRPRYGLSEDEMTFMEDISDTIAEHLHTTVARLQRQRSDRLIQALALFNSGKGSLRDWWINEEENRVIGTGRLAEVSDEMINPALRQAKINAEFGTQRDSQGGNVSAMVQTDQGEDATTSQSLESSSMQSDHRNSLSLGKIADQQTNRAGRSQHRAAPSVKFASKKEPPSAKTYEQTYSRACTLMREALGVQGVVFLDARTVNATLKRTGSEDSDKSSATNESSNHEISGTDNSITEEEPSKSSKILGSSIRSEDGLGSADARLGTQPLIVPETLLRYMIKRYPTGRVFNYSEDSVPCSSSEEEDEEGTGSSGKDGSQSTRMRRRWRSDGQRLLRVMPGARTIALFPLWDDSHGSWRSCVVLFDTSVTSPTESKDSLLYLNAFGHSLSAELSRLDTVMADRAKETFISSISHELRSPLHGVLAGVEFLQESTLTIFQQEMAHTIAMAGRTLLDTVNHLLDYAKISNFSSSQRRQRQVADASRHRAAGIANVNEIGVTANIDLANLTEELAETVVAAYRFESPSEPASRGRNGSFGATTRGPKAIHQNQSSVSSIDREGISVVLDIAWRENWTVEMQPGSWTGIVTNLVGNALKYTPRGMIAVRLDVTAGDDDPDENHGVVRLVVEDTGNGISEAYLANDLFSPFKQEDSHSTGTGLGLNIVKKIADSMGAEINVESEVGKGTRVILTFEARFTQSSPSTDGSSKSTAAEETWDTSLDRVVLLAPKLEQGDISPDNKPRISTIGKSVLRTCQAWLKCDALAELNFEPGSNSSVCAMTEDDLFALSTADPAAFSSTMETIASQKTTLLVLGSSIQSLTLYQNPLQQGVSPVFVHQPIGPRKLLRAISTKTSSSASLDATDRRRSISNDYAGMGTRPASASAQPNTPAPTPGSETSSQWDTVLLVEDNNVNMKLLVALLQGLSIKYKCAVNGREALEIYRSMPRRIFLVLMDMSMPVMDGYTSTSKIRETARARRVPQTTIVAVTGVTNEEAKQHAFESGVDEYQTKPINMRALKKLIDWAQHRGD